MYRLLFFEPFSSTLTAFENEPSLTHTAINQIQPQIALKQKSFLCKTCFRMAPGTVGPSKGLCTGGCEEFTVCPKNSLSRFLYKNDSGNFFDRLYTVLCTKYKHVSLKESLEIY